MKYGEYSYAGPLTRLFCIYFNNYPPTNTFYDSKSSVSNDEANDIESSATTFGTNLFTSVQNEANNYYSIGGGLYGVFTVGGTTTSKRNFPLPKPNFSGMCNYNKPALYLQDEVSECVGELVMNQATCEGSAFNPSYYYSPILQLITNPQSSTSVVDVTKTATHYLIDSTGTYATTTTLASTFTAGTPATCANHVKQVYYTFTYEARTDGFLIPTAVDVQLIMQTTSSSSGSVSIPQKFVTYYQLANAAGEIFYKSGNPGYLDLEPLLVGTVDSTTGGITSPKDGLMMPMSSTTCITATSAASAFTTSADNVLRFNQNMTVNCYLQATANTAAAFQTLCNSPALTTYAIFDKLTSMTRIGRYGNANVNYPSDWVTVIEQDLNYGTTTYDSTAQSCTLITEVDVQMLTSNVGFPDNQHAYIVTARKKGIASTIYFNDFLLNQRIDLKVSFEYTKVIESEASLSAYVSSSNYNWPTDLFWAFGELNGSSGFGVSTLSAI